MNQSKTVLARDGGREAGVYWQFNSGCFLFPWPFLVFFLGFFGLGSSSSSLALTTFRFNTFALKLCI